MDQKTDKAMLPHFRKALLELQRERANLDMKIESVAMIVKGLEEIYGAEEDLKSLSDSGLANACREVLKSYFTFMQPLEVRDRLIQRGFDLSRYSNPVAAIHTVLKRFVEKGEAEPQSKGAKTLYRFKPVRFPRLRKKRQTKNGR
jgi:hypothetical protein